MTKKLRYGIVGAGAAGCTLAWHLTRNGHDVHIFEKWDGLGGLAASIPFGNTQLDRFYHHIFTSDTHIQVFAERLGLKDKLLWCDSTVGFEHQGKLYPFTTPVDLLRFTPLPFLSRIRTGLAVLRAKRIQSYLDLEHITAEEWIIRVMGESSYRILWEPLLRSKFGESYREVSAVWFWGKVKLRGGTRSKSGTGECLGYMKDGWAQIYERMGEKITEQGGEFHLREIVEEISQTASSTIQLKTRKGEYEFDKVIVTPSVPSFLNMVPTLPEEYRTAVSQIPYQANITMALGVKKSLSPYYWLNITDPDSPFVAVIEHTRLLNDPNYGDSVPIYLSRYLSTDHPYYKMSSNQLKPIFLDGLRKVFPEFQDDWVTSFTCSKAEYTQPVIGLHYSKNKPGFETPIPGLYLCTMVQIYPEDRGMNYSIKIAEELLQHIGEIDELSA